MERYEELEMEVIVFETVLETEDVITTSDTVTQEV